MGNTMGPRMSMLLNPAMGVPQANFTASAPAGWGGWQGQQVPSPMMLPQQFMFGPQQMNTDPNFLVAHQQAMLIAKQAYQYAVAQQAMAAAADEWERGSNISGFGAGPNMPNMGVGAFAGRPMGGVQPSLGMGMGMGSAAQPMWGMGTPMFPQGPQSMYAGSTTGALGDANERWTASSAYGDSYGPAATSGTRRSQIMGNGAGPSSLPRAESSGHLQVPASSRSGPRPRTRTAPSNSPLPAQHSGYRSGGEHNRGPPSSWKVGA